MSDAPRNVSLSIGGRNHVISVGADEEAHLRMLAAMIDDRVSRLGIAGEVERRIEQHRAMARRQHEAVAIGPARRIGIEFQELRPEDRGDIGHAHRHAGVAGIGRLHCVHRKRADCVRHGCQRGI